VVDVPTALVSVKSVKIAWPVEFVIIVVVPPNVLPLGVVMNAVTGTFGTPGPPGMVSLITGCGENTAPLVTRGAGAVVSGDAEIANSYRELLSLARPDFEEELSRLIGDVPARRIAQLALKTVEWARKARRATGENIAEYLQEESRDLVNKTELDEFLQGVDTLRETADRVDARIARLERRLQGPA
jgi:ubiquinone biosynthesis protein UbiJ